ncbi:MAG: sensor histidine kinase, partial [Limisphaerales bacterium]
IVWAVNPNNDSLDCFVPYICEYIQAFLEPTAIRFSLVISDQLPKCPLSSETRHNLYMVIREALNNIAKHAQASEVVFRLKAEPTGLFISIEDNGKGFSREINSAFGNGLRNMRKRMENIGGCFELHSEPAQGTKIKIEVPTKTGA